MFESNPTLFKSAKKKVEKYYNIIKKQKNSANNIENNIIKLKNTSNSVNNIKITDLALIKENINDLNSTKLLEIIEETQKSLIQIDKEYTNEEPEDNDVFILNNPNDNEYTTPIKYTDYINFFKNGGQKKTNNELYDYRQYCLFKYFNQGQPSTSLVFRNLFSSQSFNLNTYNEFERYIINKFISKPHKNSSYASQGCCSVGEYILTTSYDTGYHDKNSDKQEPKKSQLNIIDKEGREKTLYFKHEGHVGGITYNEENNLIYVSGQYKDESENTIYTVEIYDAYELSNYQNNEIITPTKTYVINQETDQIDRASYLTTHNNTLFVGKWKENDYGTVSRYELDEEGMPQYIESFTPPITNVQGMAIYEYNGEEYYIFSSSYGRTNDSKLYIGKKNNDGTFEEVKSITMPCMVEQVSIDNNGDLMLIFESDCIKYAENADGTKKDGEEIFSTTQIEDIMFLNIENIIKNNT